MTADVELLRAENKRLANALQSLLRYVERCREAGVLVCDDIGPEEFARYELEQALSLPPEQPAAAQQGQAVAWADEWRAAVAAKLSSYGLSEEAAAVFASSELDEYKAGLCDCAENDPVDMVDLMMGVARDAIEKWKIESAGRPFGHKNTAPPPSAPVGVEAIAAEIRASLGRGATVCTRRRWAIELEALAQQPAAVDEAMVERAAAAVMSAPPGISVEAYVRIVLEAALTTQHQEPKS